LIVMQDTDAIFRSLFRGRFYSSEVSVQWQDSSTSLPATLKARIDAHWQNAVQQTDKKDYIYDGELCRLNSWDVEKGRLRLHLQKTSYKALLYSNQHAAEIVGQFGSECLSRALGISLILVSSDGRLVLIRRSATVGESPGKIDVIGGHVTPLEHMVDGLPDPFFAMAEELHEETGIAVADDEAIVLVGLIETALTRKPELIFLLRSSLTATDIATTGRMHRSAEIDSFLLLPDRRGTIKTFLSDNRETVSPSAFGTLWLYAQMCAS